MFSTYETRHRARIGRRRRLPYQVKPCENQTLQGVRMHEGGSTCTGLESAVPGRGPGGIFELSDQYIVDSAALDPVLASFWGIPVTTTR